jgi:hypothetical protein
LAKIEAVLNDMKAGGGKSLDEVKKAFNLIVGISEVFRNGTFQEKQEALSALGSNLTIREKKVSVINAEIFKLISKALFEARAKNDKFEPKKCEADKDETDVFTSVCPTLLAWQDSFRTFNWREALGDPEVTMSQINELISLV